MTFTGAGVASATTAHHPRVVGHVYEATNAAAGNAIQVFDRTSDGALTATGSVPTGGLGAGVSLHSQNGVVREGNLLFVVNAGDNSVSTLAITDHGLVARDTISSGGVLPVSITATGGVAYVLNQTSDTVNGFRYTRSGHLSALPDSERSLTPNPAGGFTDAAQVSFTPDGSALVVTEKASNNIDTFAVRGSGRLGSAQSKAAAGTTPYGFDFDNNGHIIVSEAATGSASSYRLDRHVLNTISGAVSDTQAAACWLVVSRDGHTAYAVNAASATISSYRISHNGTLALSIAVAASTGTASGPTDASVSADGRSLNVRLADGTVVSYQIAGNGDLSSAALAKGAVAIGSSGLATD